MNGDKLFKLVILISGSGSNLQALIDAIACGQLDVQIVGVISNRSSAAGLVRAKCSNIPTRIIDHNHFDDRNKYDNRLAETVKSYSPDLVVLAGFMRILGPRFVDRFIGKLINIHPSLLPRHPGLNTHQRALDAGDLETGATVHFVTSELDSGPAIVQASVPIKTKDCADTIAKRVLKIEHIIVPIATQWLAEGRVEMRGKNAIFDGIALPPCGKLVATETGGLN